jgi:chaperonin cofactor prefoldin
MANEMVIQLDKVHKSCCIGELDVESVKLNVKDLSDQLDDIKSELKDMNDELTKYLEGTDPEEET